MKRHIFYIAAIAALSLSAAISSLTTYASAHPAESAKGIHPRDLILKPAVKEISQGDPAPEATDRPIVIDFYATWCGPCKSYKPIFDKVAKDYKKKATFYRADVDKCTELSEKYSITSIPTTIILTPDGHIYKSVGAISEDQLRHDIDTALR